MRLKLLTNLNTLLLVAVCVALGATLWWSQKALERPYLLMERYLGLSQQFQNEVARNVEDYLGSGDALRLSSASQAIDSLQKELGELPPALAETLRPSLSGLEEFSKTDLLAAGKLAGDPQALLLQAERELSASLDQLNTYAGGNAAYLTPLLAASQHLGKLSLARDKLVSSGRSELAADVEREVTNIRTQAQAIDALPLLGVVASSESGSDDFASMMGIESTEKAVAEDAGVGLKRDLNSLLNRYPAELARTRDQIQKRTDLSTATHQKIAAVQQAIAGLEPVVRAQHGQIQSEVRLMQGVMIGLILLIALLIDTLQRRLARTLTNLAPALSTWAEGDFSRDIHLGKTNRELHDIEASLNRLRAYLVDLVGTIRGNAEQVAGSSRTLAELSNDLHSGAEHQAGDTALIRDSLSELEATIQQVAGDARQAADASRHAGLAVEHGQKVIGQSLTGLHALVGEVQGNAQMIEHLAEESATIGGVLTVIRSIADQTNLLALNAAIEAARAGEQGRGFAVVADEVRALARRTQQSTEEIERLVSTLRSAAHASVQQIQSSGELVKLAVSDALQTESALGSIAAAVSLIQQMNQQIAAAAEEQSSVAEEINRSVTSIRASADQSSMAMRGNAVSSVELARLGGELKGMVGHFRL